jgi:hypothetical protein
MFSNTNQTLMQPSFITSTQPHEAYSATLSPFVSGTNSFQHPDTVIKLLLEHFHRYQFNSSPNNTASYYFWVRSILKEINIMETEEAGPIPSIKQIIINRINVIDPVFISFDSGFGKLLAAFISFYPDYYTEIRPELLEKMKLSTPFAVDWNKLPEIFISIITMPGEANREYRAIVFDVCKHFLRDDQLKEIYQAAQKQALPEVSLMIQVLQVFPCTLFDEAYRELLNFSSRDWDNTKCSVVLEISDAIFNLLNEDLLILLYNYVTNGLDKYGSLANPKLKILTKLIDIFPELMAQYFSASVNQTAILKLIYEAVSNSKNILETIKNTSIIAKYIDEFYPKLFITYNHSRVNNNFMLFTLKQVDLIPNEIKVSLLCNEIDGKTGSSDWAIASDYIRLIYLSLDRETGKRFEDYFFEIIKNMDVDSASIWPFILKLFANFLSYSKHPTEAIVLMQKYYYHFSGNEKAFSLIAGGFIADGVNFLPPIQLMAFADFIFPFLVHKNHAFLAAQILRIIYNEMLSADQLLIQQKLTTYIKAALALPDDKACLYNLTDLSYMFKACNNPDIMDPDFVIIMPAAIERLFLIVANLQKILFSINGKDEADTQKELEKYYLWSVLSFRNLSYFTTTEQKNYFFEKLFDYVSHPLMRSAGNALEYLLEHYQEYATTLQAKVFTAYVGTMLIPGVETLEHLFENQLNDNNDELVKTFKKVHKLCLNKDNSVNHANTTFVIDNMINKQSSPLLYFLQLLNKENRESYMKYALIKLTEAIPTDKNTNAIAMSKNILSAILYKLAYDNNIIENLHPHVQEQSLAVMISNYLQ